MAIRGAVDAGTVAGCRELIWAAMERRGVRRDDPGSWPPLVEGMDDLAGEPFGEDTARSSLAPCAGCFPADRRLSTKRADRAGPVGALRAAGGSGRSKRRSHCGAVPKAVPGRAIANATGRYHIEGSYAAPDGSGGGWVNIRSRARGLLALFLLTDVGRHDAPTRLLCGSHLAVPRFLAPYGEAGTDSDADFWRPSTLCMTAATRSAGKSGQTSLFPASSTRQSPTACPSSVMARCLAG